MSRFSFILGLGKKIPKKIAKKFKKLKNLFPALYLAKTGCDKPRKRKKKFSPELCSYPTRARKFKQKIGKIIKKLKNFFPALFLAKMGGDRLTKRKKIF